MWSVLLLVGLTEAASFAAGLASFVDEKSGEYASSAWSCSSLFFSEVVQRALEEKPPLSSTWNNLCAGNSIKDSTSFASHANSERDRVLPAYNPNIWQTETAFELEELGKD